MSCVGITLESANLLHQLRSWPYRGTGIKLDHLRRMPEWGQARQWGWIMESGELTGMGSAHAGGDYLPIGILPAEPSN